MKASQKAHLPRLVGEQFAVDQREKIIAAGKNRKQHAADQYIMKMRDDEKRVVRLKIERRHRHHDTGQAAENEDHQAAEGIKHRHRMDQPPRPERGDKQKICTPVGSATACEAAEKSPSVIPGKPVVNM